MANELTYQSEFTGEQMDARFTAVATLIAALEELTTVVAGKYVKPADGIPSTDMTAAVQASLAKAESAVQSLADYYTKTEVDQLLAAINGMDYVDVSTLPTASASTMGKIYLVGPDASGYYAYYYTSYDGTDYSWVGPLGTTEISLSNYATKAELNQLDQDCVPIIKAVDALGWTPDIYKDFVFNGASSVAILTRPIVLSQDGDSIEIELSASDGALNPYGYGFSQSPESSWRGIAATGDAWSVRSDDGTWILASTGKGHNGKIKITYQNGNIVFSSPGYSGADVIYTGQKTLTIARFGYSPTIGTTPKYWTGTIKSIKVNGTDYDLKSNATLTDVNYTTVEGNKSFLTTSEKAGLTRPLIAKSAEVDGQARLSIYVPQREGYVEYLLARVVDNSINLDTWGVLYCYKTDNNLARTTQITTFGNWECAIKLSGREDNAGGFAHGDETLDSITFFADSAENSLADMASGVLCDSFRILVASSLYDPADGTTVFATHTLEYLFSRDGLRLQQTINWEEDETLGNSYMAMLPIAQAVTDHYCSDKDFTPVAIAAGGMNQVHIMGTKRVNIWGEDSGVFASFGVGYYPEIVNPPHFFGHNNGGTTYNKLYFFSTIPGGGSTVAVNDVWRTETVYKIQA